MFLLFSLTLGCAGIRPVSACFGSWRGSVARWKGRGLNALLVWSDSNRCAIAAIGGLVSSLQSLDSSFRLYLLRVLPSSPLPCCPNPQPSTPKTQ